jgi:hypothetical protein
VDPLGDREELRVPLDDDPAGVDAGPPDVREQRLKHLGNPAARGGRVDVQHRAASERVLRRVGDPLEAGRAFRPDQRLESRGVKRLHLDLLEPAHVSTRAHGRVTPPPSDEL